MGSDKADLLLHPERFRLLKAFGRQERTASELSQRVPTIAPASLYRHLKALVEGGILQVVEERPVGQRNMREKVYAVADGETMLLASDWEQASHEDRQRYFTVFLASLLDDFSQYQEQQDGFASAEEDVFYALHSLYLSKEDYQQVMQALQTVLQPWLSQRPGPDRHGYRLALTAIPQVDQATEV